MIVQPQTGTLRKCTGCQEAKPISEFYQNKSYTDGYSTRCKKCLCKREPCPICSEPKQQTSAFCKKCTPYVKAGIPPQDIPVLRTEHNQPLPQGLRRCSACGSIKSLDDFYQNQCYTDGYSTHCKRCVIAYTQLYQKRRPEVVRQALVRFRERHSKVCVDCGQRISPESVRCVACHNKYVQDRARVESQECRNRLLEKGEKACSKCGQLKPLSGFYKSKKRQDGYSARCKTCLTKNCKPTTQYAKCPDCGGRKVKKSLRCANCAAHLWREARHERLLAAIK